MDDYDTVAELIVNGRKLRMKCKHVHMGCASSMLREE